MKRTPLKRKTPLKARHTSRYSTRNLTRLVSNIRDAWTSDEVLAKKSNSPYWRLQADKVWRELVFEIRVNRCARCHQTTSVNGYPMQVHHIRHRTHRSTRHELANGMLLCAVCHGWVHHHPVLAAAWLGTVFALDLKNPMYHHKETWKEAYERLVALKEKT